MKSDTSLLNHAAFDASRSQWMHVCPLGEHPWTSEDGTETIIQVIDEEACRLMASGYPLSGPQSRVDVDHKSMDPKNTTEASAWGKHAEARDNGVWVSADLTAYGEPLVKGKVYQYTSPCFPRDGLVHLGGNRYRVTKLGVIALTNDPNLRGQQPLTNSRSKTANPNTPPKTMDYKAMLLKALGLPPEATDEQITAACNASATDKTTTANRLTELEGMLANRDLDEHGITDSDQRKLLAPSLTNKATRPAALALLAKGKAATTEPRQPMHNRGGKVPGTITELSKEEEADEAAFHAEVLDYQNSKGCSYQKAHNYVSNRRRSAAKK